MRFLVRMLRGYGVTFLIIQGYTLFFWHLSERLGVIVSSALAGSVALALVIYFEKNNRKALTIVWWLVASSAITFAISLFLVPMLVVRIPSDYFNHAKRHSKKPEKYPPVLRIIVLILKNITGLVLLLAGILMLVLPGQGLFTMFVGIMMMNFPGKYRLERRIVEFGPVLKSINWLRRRAGHVPLVLSDERA